MARAPFKLRSGNASAFKNLGSSPAKQGSSGSPRYTSPIDHPDGPDGDTKSGEPKPGEPGEPDTPKPKSQSGEGKAMKTFKKIKRPTVNLPEEIKSKLPTTPRKDTLKGITQFDFDMKPVTNVLNRVAKPYKKVGKKVLEVHKKINPIATYKKVKKYFTEK